MTTTLEQQIAAKEAELARLKDKANKLDARQKIILGGAVLSLARENENFARQLIQIIDAKVTRKSDKDALSVIVSELKNLDLPEAIRPI